MSRNGLRVVKEYKAEDAGQAVSWINTERKVHDDGPDYIHATIGLARVGLEGAAYTCHEYKPGKFGMSYDSVWGFEDATELTVSAPDQSGHIETRAGKVPRWSRELAKTPGDPYGFRDRSFTDDFGHFKRPESGAGEWSLGNQDIVSSLRRQLAAENVMHLYPLAYYTLAVMADADMQLIDPAMQAQTEIELAIANHRRDQLRRLYSDDHRMLGRVEAYSRMDHELLVRDFTALRRDMHETETELNYLANATAVKGRMILPVGKGRAGRNWPYMDAAESDETKAFGRELHALQSHNFGRPIYELEKEIKELEYRWQESQFEAGQLASLARKETEAAADV